LIRLLRHPGLNTKTRFWGVGTTVQRGLSGAPVLADSGYSGHPLTLVPHRPPLSGQPWMFVADSARMRKIRDDGLSLPIGLPAPATPTTAMATEYSRVIG
jgi:hypothetical protein